jgi:ornithine cyclodeaminase/alanine dehydrogenase-like protein (mu-crystallin family)
MLAVGANDIRELIPMPLAVELMKLVFSDYSAGKTISPLRVPIEMPDGSGVSLFMPAYVPAINDFPATSGAKIVSAYMSNVERGIPTIHALVIALDPKTGRPEGVLEGGTLTALRTGAVSGAATDLMARGDASILAIIGAGAQGVTQAAAVAAVREITEIRVFDTSKDMLNTYASRLAVWNPSAADLVGIAESARDALMNADVVCTATTSPTPVFDDDWLASGTHINAVGAFTPQMQEIPVETVLRARIVVDAIDAVLHEAGDLIIPIRSGMLSADDVTIELGAVADARVLGRVSDEQITLFKSVGNAIQDMIVAGAATQRARQHGFGQEISFT